MTRHEQEDDMQTLLTVEEAVEALGRKFSVKTVYRWAADGRMPSLKVGGKRLFQRGALLQWLAQHATGMVQ